MRIREKIAERFFGDVINTRIKAAAQEQLKAATVADLAKEDIGWRKLTGDANRNLSPLNQERMQEIAYFLWENNVLAHWTIEITKDFMLADGLPYEAKNPDVKKVLDDFWYDPLNRMDLYIEKHGRELLLFGELCFPAFAAQQTGRLRLGYIDPSCIKEVVTDPDNVKVVIGVILKSVLGQNERRLKTIIDEDAEYILSNTARTEREKYTDGECFFFAINNVTNSPRGRSDILHTADWLDAYEQFLFDYADKWPLLNTFVWDIQVDGATSEQINEHVKKFTKKSGSIFGHNEKVKLGASTPDLKAVDAAEGARLFRNHILGGHSIPEHWFGGSGDVNRATAVEMSSPAYKTLSSKQRYFKFVLESILGNVISRQRKSRYLNVSDEDAKAFSIITPEISAKDVTQHSSAIQQVTTSIAVAETNGWIDKDTARKIFAVVTAPLGVELDIDAVKEAVKEEEEKKGYEDYLKNPPPAPSKGG